MARSQVLAAAKVFSAPLTAAAWKTKPSWGIVAGDDQIISPSLERGTMPAPRATRSKSKAQATRCSPLIPKEVAAVIVEAALKQFKKNGYEARKQRKCHSSQSGRKTQARLSFTMNIPESGGIM